MTCPHCQASLTGKERPNLTCSKCGKYFAFEPKQNALRLHDLKFRASVDRLGSGGFKYTARQLRLALSRKPPTPPGGYGAAIGLTSLGLLLTIVLAFAGGGKAIAAGLGLTLAGIIVGLSKAFGGQAEVTDATFQGEFINRWHAVYGEMPSGLIDESALAGLTVEDRPSQNLLGVVVCPDQDLLKCLLANGVPRDLQLGLLSTAAPADAWENGLLELLKKNPQLPILLLHDASAEHAFLARDLPQILGLSAGHRIFDLGLNPKKSISKQRQVIKRLVPSEVAARLDQEAMGSDVGGSRPIRRGRAQVSAEEVWWLKEGNCSPILAVPPASLIKRLKFTLDKIAPKHDPQRAEARALAAAGFFTSPA